MQSHSTRVPRTCQHCGKAFSVKPSQITIGEGKYCSSACYHGRNGSPEDRLLSKRRINPETGCWEWTGCVDSWGYGQMMVNRKLHLIHRLSLHLFRDFDIDSNQPVLHSCDNPRCFNPDHLSPGTIAENNQQQFDRGRSNKGSKNPRAKLTESQVREIRDKYAAGVSRKLLAEEYHVAYNTVVRIVCNDLWKHIS